MRERKGKSIDNVTKKRGINNMLVRDLEKDERDRESKKGCQRGEMKIMFVREKDKAERKKR